MVTRSSFLFLWVIRLAFGLMIRKGAVCDQVTDGQRISDWISDFALWRINGIAL